MIKRYFAGKPSHLTFTKDYREFLNGDIAPGNIVRIEYDAERLPQSRAEDWSISCYAKFRDDTSPSVYKLWSETGNTLTKADDAPGGGTMLIGEITIPENAQLFVIWFVLTDYSGVAYYDSDFGKNFSFPFLEDDIRVAGASVSSTAGQASGVFKVEVECAPGIDGVVLDYRVGNQQPVALATTTVPLSAAGEASDGWGRWTGEELVPFGAVVAFSVTYSKAGRRYFDDNHHRGYLASASSTIDANGSGAKKASATAKGKAK